MTVYTNPAAGAGDEAICYISAALALLGDRVRRVLAEDRPALLGYDQDLWAARLGYDNRDVRRDLDLFDVVRRANLALLARADETDMSRAGFHQERGEETVELMVRL